MLMPKMSHWECVHMTRGCRESVTCQKKESKHEQHKQRKDETRTKRNREITWMVVNQSKNYLANFVGVVMMTRPEVGNTANSSNQTKTSHRIVKENERRGEVYELIDLPILRTWAHTFSGNGDIRGKNRDKRCFGSFCQEGMDFSRIHKGDCRWKWRKMALRCARKPRKSEWYLNFERSIVVVSTIFHRNDLLRAMHWCFIKTTVQHCTFSTLVHQNELYTLYTYVTK